MKRVVIVDDSPENITVLGALLRTDYGVKVATSGDKALKIVDSDNPPDLILLDVMMPGLSGIEVYDRLRAEEAIQDMPVLFVTAQTGQFADDFARRRIKNVLAKPFDLNDLLKWVVDLCPP